MKPLRINFLKPYVIVALIMLVMACEDFVAVDPPESELIRETVFSDDKTAEAALMDVYGQMRTTSPFQGGVVGFSVLLGHYSDELVLYSYNLRYLEDFYRHTIVSGNSQISSIWNDNYNLIYAVNTILEGLQNSKAVSPGISNQLQGEAFFIRGFIHFYMLNLFGEIPYITTTDYHKNTGPERKDIETVYTLIFEDIERARSLLSTDYPTEERIRSNKWTCSALLSRIYLYHEDWQKAEKEATKVIEQNKYSLTPLKETFLKSSTEAIWQFMPENPGGNTLEAHAFIYTSTPPPIALSDNFIESLEDRDQRFIEWISGNSNDSETWYYPYKYKENINTGTSKEYTIVLRLAEQYLIRAEARARQGDLTNAITDLDVIRERAGLPSIADTHSNISQQALLDAILRERRIELFTEFGHRWFDLKRVGKAKQVLENLKPGWKDTDILLPIPQKELLINPNLEPQNPGYN